MPRKQDGFSESYAAPTQQDDALERSAAVAAKNLETIKSAETKKDSGPKIRCKVGTANAVIGGVKHEHGAEIEMTAEDIRRHRRQGVAIHCDEEAERQVRGDHDAVKPDQRIA